MVAICLVLMGVILWNPQRVAYPFRVFFGVVALPFEKVFSVLGFHSASVYDFLSSVGGLKQENDRLVRENVRLAAENALLIDMRQENETLRREFDLLPRSMFQLVAAEVIGQDRQNLGNWLMINKGSSDGIQNGMAVIVDQGAFVGRVEEVSPGTARIGLLTSPESLINGVDAQTEARGIVKGQYGLGVVMDMVLQTGVLKEGDSVVTSGLGGDLPRGLFLGKVRETKPSDDRLFQQAVLAPAVDASGLRTVFVIVGGAQ